MWNVIAKDEYYELQRAGRWLRLYDDKELLEEWEMSDNLSDEDAIKECHKRTNVVFH